MNRLSSLLLAFAVILYSAWQSSILFSHWVGAPLVLYSWAAFLVWMLPIPLFWLHYFITKPEVKWNSFPIWIALILVLFGQMGSFNTLNYFGFAFALSALIPWQWPFLAWIAGSLSWMPALGWVGSYVFPSIIVPVRIILAVAAALWALIVMWRKR
ncbi:MAG: hypothetical protein H7A37_06580 [Chlamydiales bacterium]|nr:hypothetical protein [Chlamydiia bacterium]MCP5507948.1 hypothetical protein [Chlamydiales bacterium]